MGSSCDGWKGAAVIRPETLGPLIFTPVLCAHPIHRPRGPQEWHPGPFSTVTEAARTQIEETIKRFPECFMTWVLRGACLSKGDGVLHCMMMFMHRTDRVVGGRLYLDDFGKTYHTQEVEAINRGSYGERGRGCLDGFVLRSILLIEGPVQGGPL